MIVVKAPLRVSFFGGGTDFPEFYVDHGPALILSAAIDLSVHVIVKPRWDSKILLHYSRIEQVNEVSEIQHDLIRESIGMASRISGINLVGGIEISTFGDVPAAGTGLGSSSSLTVALLQALTAFQGLQLNEAALVKAAWGVEIDLVGSPIGRQDQIAAAFGGIGYLTLNTGIYDFTRDEVCLRPATFAALNERLMLFYTGRTRRSGAILGAQRANIPEKVSTLRRIAEFAEIGREMLESSQLDNFGVLLGHAWEDKKTLASCISDPEIDALYDRALAAGALGGKICGAGGGGFLLLYVPPERQDTVREALKELREVRIRLGAPGARVVYQDGGLR